MVPPYLSALTGEMQTFHREGGKMPQKIERKIVNKLIFLFNRNDRKNSPNHQLFYSHNLISIKIPLS